MAKGLENYPNIITPSSDFPKGRIKDRSAGGAGTPVNQLTNDDLHQTFQKWLTEAGITANNLPENVTNGYQYFQAMLDVMHKYVSSGLMKGIMPGYTPNDVIVLYGCVVTPGTLPGSAGAITAGEIFYNGKIYKVPAASGIVTTGVQTLVFNIKAIPTPSFIALEGGALGSGIADYNGATVKKLFDILTRNVLNNKFDKQSDQAAPNVAYPTSGTTSTLGAIITAATGYNRNYTLSFAMDWNVISTNPEMYISFWDVTGTPAMLKEFHFAAFSGGGTTQLTQCFWPVSNVAPGTKYQMKIRSNSTNQINVQSYVFMIDGTPVTI